MTETGEKIPGGFTADEWEQLRRYNNDPVFHAAVHVYWEVKRRHGDWSTSSRPTMTDIMIVAELERRGVSWHPPIETPGEPTRYDAFPGHPLCGVPKEILDAAREVMAAAVEDKDIEERMAEPLADAVVSVLRPWLRLSG